MLAHELTHVVQQRSGPVDGTSAGGGISLSDPSDRFERAAEDNANRFVSSERAPVDTGAGSASPAPAVQRSGEHDDDQTVQGLFVQHEDAGEEEEEPVQGSFVQREGEEGTRGGGGFRIEGYFRTPNLGFLVRRQTKTPASAYSSSVAERPTGRQ